MTLPSQTLWGVDSERYVPDADYDAPFQAKILKGATIFKVREDGLTQCIGAVYDCDGQHVGQIMVRWNDGVQQVLHLPLARCYEFSDGGFDLIYACVMHV